MPDLQMLEKGEFHSKKIDSAQIKKLILLSEYLKKIKNPQGLKIDSLINSYYRALLKFQFIWNNYSRSNSKEIERLTEMYSDIRSFYSKLSKITIYLTDFYEEKAIINFITLHISFKGSIDYLKSQCEKRMDRYK